MPTKNACDFHKILYNLPDKISKIHYLPGMSQEQLKELISKNYTGDAGDYESALLAWMERRASASVRDTMDSSSMVSSGEAIVVPVTIAPEIADTDIDDPNRKLTREEALALKEAEDDYRSALAFVKDAVAPAMMKIEADGIQIGDVYSRTFYTYAYPDFLEGNWLSPIINWDVKFDMSMFVYPIESAYIAKYLRKRLTELHSQRSINVDKGLLSDPGLDAQIQDVEELRQSLTRGQERYFHFSIYVTLYSDSRDNLKKLANTFDSLLSGRNILSKQSYLRAEQGFISTGPFAKDEVGVYRNISTKGLSTTFPFTSNSLSHDDGVLYGINTHNNSLIIFDRFRSENANMVVFAKSG